MSPFEKSNLPSLAVGIALLSALLAIAAKNMVVDLDLFHEMALYRQAESEGAMPTTDSFAYTPTNNPVVHHEWATGAVLYLICVKLGYGAAGLVWTKYLLTFGVGVGCFWYARRRSVPLAVFAVLAPIALNLGGWMAFTNIRAQLFTLFFLVVMLLLIDVDRRGKRWWIAVWLPLVVAWGNIHGGVVSGIGLMGCYGIARVLESWLATRSLVQTVRQVAYLIVTGIATGMLLLVNPYGWSYIPYLFRAIRMPRPLIPEWNPIWRLETNDALVFWLVSVGIALLAFTFSMNRPAGDQDENVVVDGTETAAGQGWQHDLFTPLALMLTAWMAAKHYRHGSLYAVTWLCLVPPLLNRTSLALAVENLWQQHQKTIAVVATGIAVVALGFAVQAKFWQLRVPGQRDYPGEAVLVVSSWARCNFWLSNSLKETCLCPLMWAPSCPGNWLRESKSVSIAATKWLTLKGPWSPTSRFIMLSINGKKPLNSTVLTRF